MQHLHYLNYLFAFALVCFGTSVLSSNILVVSPVPSDSHFKISEAITTGLADAGHTVTTVSAYGYKSQNVSKVQWIQVKGIVKWMEEFKATDYGAFEKLPVDKIVSVLFYRGVDLCNLTLTDPHVKALFNRSYDLVIVDVFGTESLIGLGQIFHAPVIGFSTYSTARWTNMSPLSYESHFPDWMVSLFHRLHNIIFYNMYESIALAYSHHPLQDFKQFVDTATDGIVYLSIGFISKGKESHRNAFIKTIAKMKQKFIWKFSDPTVQMPENVFAKSLLPQIDILGHTNVKAFVSHGGLLDCIEAVYYGIPVLGIPLSGDQQENIKRASATGWALTLDYNNITADSVEWALNEILQDKYSTTAQTMSKQHRDQPMTPISTVIYWSEYVI